MSKWIEREHSAGSAETLDHMTGRRCLKTHAPSHLVPWAGGVASGIGGKRRVVVVTRNPLDACVSMFHHTVDLPMFLFKGGFQQFVNM